MTCHLIRQDGLVISPIIKNKTGVAACHRTVCQASAKQDFSYERIMKQRPQLPLKPKHRKERLKFTHKHIVEFMDFKQVVLMGEKRFFLDGSNFSLSIENRGDSVIAPHRFKRQMGGDGVMTLGVTCSFGNFVIKVTESKYNSLKYLDDLQTNFILWFTDNLTRTKGFGSKEMLVFTLQK